MAPLNLTDLRPDRTIDPDGLDTARALLDARIASDAPSNVTELAPRRRTGAVRVGLVGAAAAAVAAVALALPNPTDPAAFAGWTAVPTTLDQPDIDAAGKACLALREEVAADEDSPVATLTAPKTVVADRRGETTFTVLVSDEGVQSCLIGPDIETTSLMTGEGGTTHVGPPEGVSGTVFGLAEGRDSAPPSADAATYSAGAVHGSDTGQPWGYGIGRVGADVVAVEVTLGNGDTVTATVDEGVWAAWWPTSTLAAKVVPILADGSEGTAPEFDPTTVRVVVEESGEPTNLEVEHGDAEPESVVENVAPED